MPLDWTYLDVRMTTTIKVGVPGKPVGSTTSVEVTSYEVTSGGVLKMKLPNGDIEYRAPGTWTKVIAPKTKPASPVPGEPDGDNIMDANF